VQFKDLAERHRWTRLGIGCGGECCCGEQQHFWFSPGELHTMHFYLRLFTLLAGMTLAAVGYAADAAPSLTTPDQLGPKIEQPIEFPHFRHAGDEKDGGMQINCMYCHTYARRSMVAGIPPIQKCIGCHKSIPSVQDKPRIKKLFAYWDAKKAIPWKKVHDLPDFVRFNHERHIQRFYFQLDRPYQEVCGYCHGDVKKMTVARRQKPLTMGWCRACHLKDHPLTKGSTKIGHGPNDCFTCHK
jgi:hypothetical protein